MFIFKKPISDKKTKTEKPSLSWQMDGGTSSSGRFNEFDLHKNGLTDELYFQNNDFTQRLVLTQRQKRPIGFALLRYMIGLKNSRHFFSQLEVKPKAIVTRSNTFSRASRRLHVFNTLYCMCPLCT